MGYRDMNSYTILGIGGKGAYFVAKYLRLIGKQVYGYDLKQSEKTEELQSLGCLITYSNPNEGEHLNTDSYIYSNDLPQSLQKRIKNENIHIQGYEVGEIYHMILDDYESGVLSNEEIRAFVKSGIAPLYEIDCSKMKYIGITGTDGKTTSCTMVYHMLKEAGFKPALVTTVSAKIGDMNIDTGFHTTTPSSQEIYDLILKAEESGCTHMILETTSHGLAQGRIMGLKFDAIGYTNITEEHLDYHKTWENLLDAKSLLIKKHTKENAIVVLNMDDERAYERLDSIHEHISYSKIYDTDYYAQDIKEDEYGLHFKFKHIDASVDTEIPILGEYNISNFLLASSIVSELENISLESISKSISSFSTIEGRMQIIQKEPFMVIVDYAHTPNALENVLKSVRGYTNGKVINVFGTAGHRDFYKRPLMGKISNELADITILTAEDPRLESLKDINDQIEKGWREGSNSNGELIRYDDDQHNVEVRREAIKKGVELATEGDLVIITGKAHERSLCFGQVEYDWNDIDEVKKILNL